MVILDLDSIPLRISVFSFSLDYFRVRPSSDIFDYFRVRPSSDISFILDARLPPPCFFRLVVLEFAI
jgi:hypothetical protein